VTNFGKNLILWVIIGALLIALFNIFQGANDRGAYENYTYSEFMTHVKDKNVTNVKIQGDKVIGLTNTGVRFVVTTLGETDLAKRLSEQGVASVEVVPQEDRMSSFWGVLLSWFPMLLFIGVWIFFMRQMQGGGGKAMGFGKSRAKMMSEKPGRVTFDDVAGCEEAKEEVVEIVEFLRDPHKFQRLGGKIPKGVLLVGPPGTGKTLLARAIAGEANVPFFSISGSDFVEMFVGVGASRVRDMFEQGKKNAPCIIFIDELDAVGRHRGAGLGGGNDEREQTLNQLLVEMDGFETNEGVILVAATNRPDVLDPALMRPGRFDRQVVVPNPDVAGREKILEIHMKKVPLANDVDSSVIARGTPGFSGADLMNLVNEAALLAARRGRKTASMDEFEEAKDKILMGTERRSMVMTEEEKKLTAYHEGGHALVTVSCPASDPVHKATIVPRGRALGLVMRLPVGDRISMSREKLEADLAVAMGGRVAEELIFGYDKVTTGASSDIQQATDIARKMVTEWGMSDKLGPLAYGEPAGEVFLGHSVTQHKNMSDTTALDVDREVRKIVEKAYELAKQILTEKKDQLEIVAEALIEYETLSGDEIHALIKGEKIDRPTAKSKKAADKKPPKRTSSVPTVDNMANETEGTD
jgi:cell division protease FtsH